MTSSADNYKRVLEEVNNAASREGRDPKDIFLIAVSKTHPLEAILEVYQVGCRLFGESRIQEAVEKISQAPKEIHWHLIGTLQTNKINKVVGSFALIHSIDSLRLAEKIAQRSQEIGVTTPILLQVNTSGEATKHGLTTEEWKRSFEELLKLRGIQVQGLMTMAPWVKDEGVVRGCFAALRRFREDLESLGGIQLPHLSMGMSHDYPLAIAEGATLIRVGSAIFGKR